MEGDFTRQTSGLCSAASLANACRALGVTYKYAPVTETVAALVMGLHGDAIEKGAGEVAIKSGALALGFKRFPRKPTTHRIREVATGDYATALVAVGEGAVIASVDGGSHWLVLVADEQNRVVVIDADNTQPMLARISLTKLERRWRGDGGTFYGIALR